jgi:predicted DNA-binding ribbon-helix-helix protein
MDSSLVKRSVTIEGHRIGISIEGLFWTSLEEIAKAQATSTSQLIASIDAGREGANLSSAIRVYVIDHFLDRIQTLDDMDESPDDDEAQMSRLASGERRPRWLN